MRRYLISFLLAMTAFLVSVASINVLADPYAFFGLVEIESLNVRQAGGEQRGVQNVKPLQVRFSKPDTVLVGASRTQQGFDPDTLPSCGLGKVFNLGVGGLSTFDSYELARYAMVYGDAKRIFLEMNIFGSFNSPNANRRLPARLFDFRWPLEGTANALLSPRVLGRSLAKLLANLTGNAESTRLHVNGWYDKETYRSRGKQRLNKFFLAAAVDRYDGRWRRLFAVAGAGDSIRRDAGLQADYRQLDSLLAEARERGVEIVLYIPPSHFAALSILNEPGYLQIFEGWKRRLAELSVRHDVPLWDFAHHHPLAAFDAETDGNPYFMDFAHFYADVGQLLIMRMCGHPDGAEAARVVGGVRLDRVDVDAHLAEIRRRTAEFPIKVPLGRE